MFRSLVPWKQRPMLPSTDRFRGLFGDWDRDMEELIEGFWNARGNGPGMVSFVPSVDLTESENEFVVTLDLPGLKPEEVSVEFKEGALWVSGERKEEKEEKGETYHRIERSHGEFRRVLPLPSSIKEEEIEAKFTNGVLKVSMPKKEEAKAKHIEVKS